jgi:hypothetical protein
MAIMEIITVNSTSKCLSRSFLASLTVLVACLIIFSAVVHGGDDVETFLRKMEASYDFRNLRININVPDSLFQ